jgi:hypothetical protein
MIKFFLFAAGWTVLGILMGLAFTLQLLEVMP